MHRSLAALSITSILQVACDLWFLTTMSECAVGRSRMPDCMILILCLEQIKRPSWRSSTIDNAKQILVSETQRDPARNATDDDCSQSAYVCHQNTGPISFYDVCQHFHANVVLVLMRLGMLLMFFQEATGWNEKGTMRRLAYPAECLFVIARDLSIPLLDEPRWRRQICALSLIGMYSA